MAQPYFFYVYESRDASKEWRWHLMADNGRIIAVSGVSYPDKDACIDAIHLLPRQSADARIVLAGGAPRFANRIANPSEPLPPSPRFSSGRSCDFNPWHPSSADFENLLEQP